MSTPANKTSFSIVMAVNNQADELRSELPSLLTLPYDDYEVVVVDESSTDDTADVLKQQKADHKNLYTTFLPKYPFQNNPRRLAFTIGVKAAKKDWIVFTDVTTLPPSETWLEELSAYACSPSVLLLGYVNRKNGDIRLETFDDIDRARSIISKEEHHRGSNRHGWMRRLLKKTGYDYIAVRAELGHEALRLFA